MARLRESNLVLRLEALQKLHSPHEPLLALLEAVSRQQHLTKKALGRGHHEQHAARLRNLYSLFEGGLRLLQKTGGKDDRQREEQSLQQCTHMCLHGPVL
jgi:type VI protein secretion system component VasK